ERPQLATSSVWTAAALGNEAATLAELAKQPGFAAEKGGPRNWTPLLYMSFGRCGGGDGERARIARRLLENGADANAFWIHRDWPESPLPALYGATGVNDYPQLARVLLAAGANPNDGESRYHAAQYAHVASLEVLAEFGCDFSGTDQTWGNTPLYFLLGFTPPAPSVKAGVRWLLEHGANPNRVSQARSVAETPLHRAVNHDWDVETVSWLLKHGADVNARTGYGRTAYALAVRGGRVEVARLLAARGAVTDIERTDAFIGACMRGDGAEAKALLAENPTLFSELHDHDRRVALMAAREGRAEALAVMAEVGLGLDVSGPDGERPLHWAAWHGWAEAVRVLTAHGVAVSECERRFGAPPTGWCAHGSQHCANPAGEYGRVMELLLDAGAFVAPQTEGSAEVMAVLKRRGIVGRKP
ncbi:MAG TPA: ankyrin repeat domain-containing protein, partial [Opitutus sp.]|nr:ankyrin repeat domain-containing protein [Opitutus sp.]